MNLIRNSVESRPLEWVYKYLCNRTLYNYYCVVTTQDRLNLRQVLNFSHIQVIHNALR